MKGSNLIMIKQGEDYTPFIVSAGPIGGLVSPSVIALHCTKTNTSELWLKAVGDKEAMCFAKNSFILGHVYPIWLASIIDMGGASFVGYQQVNS